MGIKPDSDGPQKTFHSFSHGILTTLKLSFIQLFSLRHRPESRMNPRPPVAISMTTPGVGISISNTNETLLILPESFILKVIPLKLYGKITKIQKDRIAIRFDEVNPYFKETLDDAIWKDKGR